MSRSNAAEVPDHTTCPFSMMVCRSASFTSALRCLSTIRMAWPSSFRRARHFQMSSAQQRRQPFGCLVENEQLGIGHQGAPDRQHLLLAAGQLVAHVAPPLGELGKKVVDASSVHRGAAKREAAVAIRFSSTVSVGKICRPSGTSPRPACAIRWGGRPTQRQVVEDRAAAGGGQQAHDGAEWWWSCPCRCGPAGSPPRRRRPESRCRTAPARGRSADCRCSHCKHRALTPSRRRDRRRPPADQHGPRRARRSR